MTKTLRLLSLATMLATGFATATLAAATDGGDTESQAVTGNKLGSQQQPRPATGSGPVVTKGNPKADSYPYGRSRSGSRQPDATNPTLPTPNGGSNTK
jgi:hypothetical protein